MWIEFVLTLAATLVTVLVVVVLVSRGRWRDETESLATVVRSSTVRHAEALDAGDLPDAARRYLAFALGGEAPPIRGVTLTQTGEFRARAEDRWSPFRATQVMGVDPPGFVWDARISIAPGMTVHVRDAFVNGAGRMQGRLAAVIPVVDEQGRRELTLGSLQRYLAEAVWCPTILLPGQGLTWQPVDETRARAVMRVGDLEVSAVFEINDAGEPASVYTPSRFREENGAYVARPWEGRFGDYAERGGIRIPLYGEVSWILPEGKLTYWRGRVTSVEYILVEKGT